MFVLQSTSLVRGVVQISLIVVISALVGALSALAMTHRGSPAVLSASTQIAPIDPTCTSSSPCIEYDNNSTGQGMKGVSRQGNGLTGWTDWNSTSSSNSKYGVVGNDQSTSGAFDGGMLGKSVRGAGVSGVSTNGVGVQGDSSGNNGIFGDSTAPGASGVYGQNDGGGYGVAGRVTKLGFPAVFADAGSTGSVGLSAQSLSGIGANVVGNSPALSVVGGSGDILDVCKSGTVNPCDGAHAVLSLNSTGYFTAGDGAFCAPGCIDIQASGGNIDIFGQYLKNNSCVAGCSAATVTSLGRAVTSYSAQEASPTIEDFGESQLVDGRAYVPLSSDFANVIDGRMNYLVFITPEGDNRGLFVTNRTRAGFAVHESQGGRSSLMFSYRIVATLLGSHERRLPMVTIPRIAGPSRMTRFHMLH